MIDYGFIGGMVEGLSRRAKLETSNQKPRTKVFDWTKAIKILDSKGWPDARAGLLLIGLLQPVQL